MGARTAEEALVAERAAYVEVRRVLPGEADAAVELDGLVRGPDDDVLADRGCHARGDDRLAWPWSKIAAA